MTYPWLETAIDDGAEIVTANNRLARDLRAVYERRMLAGGRRAWRTPRILPWSVWLRELVDSAALAARVPLRLEAPASAVLWERLLREATEERLMNASGLVRQVQQTWQRLQDWCIPTEDLAAAAGSEDQRLFALVAAAYERELAANGWTDAAQLAALAGRLVQDGHLRRPRLLVHAGFDRLPPATRRLFASLGERGTTIRAAPPAERRQSLQRVTAADADGEIRAAGQWARAQLAANPSARVAVVLASLESSAERSARLLREGFVPGWQYDDRVRGAAVNVSYGRRLAEYPMIAVALLWLEWTQRGLDTREVGTLLRSPFTGSGAQGERHRMETRLRRLPDRAWSPESLAGVLAMDPSGAAAGWRVRMDEVSSFARSREEALSPAAWAERIDGFLGRLGWPGDKVPDSAEYQVLNRWRELLNELSQLEPVRRRLRCPEAVARLASLARDALFQPEGDDGRLQLLGPLEAAGLELDCVWFANLEATQWPPPARPMPLVSRNLQRRAGMPDAGPADTLEHARRILARVAESATSVVLSRPRADGEASLIPSPLLDAWQEQAPVEAEDPGWFAARLCGSPLEVVKNDAVPPVLAGERVSGGAYLVQSQFTEPFAAFALGRLGVRRMPAIEVGLSASLRGTVVHHALRTLLADKPSRTRLQGWSAVERDRRVRAAVDVALLPPSRHADAILQRLLALERRRLEGLLHMFIDAEAGRPEFTVTRVETELALRRQGVELDLRVDRIDRLDDGSLLVIDYKTGTTKNLLSAAGEPAEWQTVVYAAALDEPVGGLVLINLDSRGIVYRGVGNDVPWNPLGAAEWAGRLEEWSRAVDAAIARIAAGDARVNVARTTEQSRPLNVLSRAEALKRGA